MSERPKYEGDSRRFKGFSTRERAERMADVEYDLYTRGRGQLLRLQFGLNKLSEDEREMLRRFIREERVARLYGDPVEPLPFYLVPDDPSEGEVS